MALSELDLAMVSLFNDDLPPAVREQMQPVKVVGKLPPVARTDFDKIRFVLAFEFLIPLALDGDLQPLISYVEEGGDLNGDEIRKYVLNILRKGKVPRPKRRPRSVSTLEHHYRIAVCVKMWRLRGLGLDAASEKAAEIFDVDRATVYRALKDLTNWALSHEVAIFCY
jgi:hypothetical protein